MFSRVQEIADQQGWNLVSCHLLATRFIEDEGKLGEYILFLEEEAQKENDATERG